MDQENPQLHDQPEHKLICMCCKALKPRAEFYTQNTRGSRPTTLCKECTAARLKNAAAKRQAKPRTETITCNICGQTKPWRDFVNGKQGHRRAVGRTTCLLCRTEYMKTHGVTTDKFHMPKMPIIDGKKLCNGCEQMLPVDAFNKNASAPHGLQWKCAKCMATKLREYQNRNSNVYWMARMSNKRIYGDLPRQWVRELFETTKECAYCRHPFKDEKEGTLDHRIPLARGGTTKKENVCVACDQCNRAKNDMSELEYRAWLNAACQRLRDADYADWAERGTGT